MIQIKNLWKRYGPNQVLKGLDLEVKQGEILVILGRSGVGKSVLLKHIIGLEKPDQGTVEVNGILVSGQQEPYSSHSQPTIGMLFQGSALFDSMNVEENVSFYLKQHHKELSQKEIHRRVQEALERVDLKNTEHIMPSDLSGGMRKRAGLARLLVYRPSILLYDEPTTGLDPITAKQISELIIQTQKELNGTSVVVTHDVASALMMADRLALHREGKIAHVAEPKKFMDIDDPIVPFLKGGRIGL